MEIAIIVVLINFCLLTRASALSVEDRLVLLEHTSQLQMVILKTQQETIDQLQRTLKTQGDTVKKHQETIDQLQKTLQMQGETVKTQQETIDQLQRTLNTQGETVKTQQETIDQLRSTSKTQGKSVMYKVYENRALETWMNFLVKRVDPMKNGQEYKNLSQQNEERTMWDSSSSIIPSLPNRIKRQSTHVAFHAYVTTQTCVNDHEIIKFDREELDLPGGFNNGDGIYTVPQSGTYVFTWTFVATARTWYKTELIINGHVKGSNVAAAVSDTDPQSATGTIVTSVEAGDHVYVRKASGTNCAIERVYSQTTFSGWKLF